MNKQDKPHICEVLGVEVGERFKFTDVVGDTYSGVWIDENGDIRGESGTRLSGSDVCYIINHPECIVRRKRFTEQEIEDAKKIKENLTIKMIISRDNQFGDLCVQRIYPDWIALSKENFPSIAPGESYTLDEIIGEGTE